MIQSKHYQRGCQVYSNSRKQHHTEVEHDQGESCGLQVLLGARERVKQTAAPPGLPSSQQPREKGLGQTGDATLKEFEVSPILHPRHHSWLDVPPTRSAPKVKHQLT